MKKSGKALIATLLVGLGAGIVKKLSKGDPSKLKDHVKQQVSKAVDNGRVISAYRNLKPGQQDEVNRIIKHVVPYPEEHSYRCQKEIHQYIAMLNYASERDELHSAHAAKRLNIPRNRADQLTIGLTMQGVLEHTEAGANYVRRPLAKQMLSYLNQRFNFMDTVSINRFIKVVKDLTADHIR